MKRCAQFIVVAVWALSASYGANASAQEASASPPQNAGYESALAQWTSYEDVAHWLKSNFTFDQGRLNAILARTRQQGPAGLLARNVVSTFQLKAGYCTDAAAFAIQSLNRINPDYKAQYVFVRNRHGQPHHWVAGFIVNDRIMIMDYGASPEWVGMKGVHGPYDSLEQYSRFVASLNISKFSPESVEWRSAFPGQQD